MCQPVVSANRSLHKRRLPVVGPRPNNSFNPNPLRYTNSMADQACHAVGSTTQVGLTQALGLMTDIHPLFFVALIVLLGWLGLTGIKTLARSRSLSARRLLFVVGVVLFLALAGGASWTLVRADQTGLIRCTGHRWWFCFTGIRTNALFVDFLLPWFRLCFFPCVDCLARVALAHRHQDARPVSIVIVQAFVICRWGCSFSCAGWRSLMDFSSGRADRRNSLPWHKVVVLLHWHPNQRFTGRSSHSMLSPRLSSLRWQSYFSFLRSGQWANEA